MIDSYKQIIYYLVAYQLSNTDWGGEKLTLIHNHPSGNARPSGDDDRITHKLKTACDAMRLYLIDHLIVTDGNYYSYAEEGKI
jgi:DNA repair protein RadC